MYDIILGSDKFWEDKVGTGIWDAVRFEIDVEQWFSIFFFFFFPFFLVSEHFHSLKNYRKFQRPFVYMGCIYQHLLYYKLKLRNFETQEYTSTHSIS